MPELHTLITYLAVLTGFVFFPGPSILLTLARASSSGTRVGVATSLGIALGDLMHTALAVVGISAIVLASAEAFFVIKMLGAGYLIWLG
ncbi:LysE family translocator, partial [Pararhodobacter marinus]